MTNFKEEKATVFCPQALSCPSTSRKERELPAADRPSYHGCPVDTDRSFVQATVSGGWVFWCRRPSEDRVNIYKRILTGKIALRN